MAKRLSISLDDEAFELIELEGGQNKSAFISEVLKDWKRRHFEETIRRQLLEDADDQELNAEMDLWENTTADGLDDND